jgi:hypothetical protein
MLGRELVTLVNDYQTPGYKRVALNPYGFASGAYVYRLTAGNFSDAKKFVLMR